MLRKLVYSRLIRPVLAAVMVFSLFIGVSSAAYPAAKQSEAITSLTHNALINLRTLSVSITELGEDRLKALANLPMQGNDFKKLSGLLTEVKESSGYERLYLVGYVDGQLVTLCDSDYRDTGTAGLTYFAPGSKLEDKLAASLSNGLKKVLEGKSDYTASEKVFNREEEQLLGAVVPVRDRTGAVQGALIAELPAENLHFTQLGFLDLELLSYLGFLLFALSLLALVLLHKLKKRYDLRTQESAPVAQEPMDSVAGLFELPEPEELGFTAEPPVQEEPPADTETPEPPAEQ